MKKKDVINLIRYHLEGNNTAFLDEAYGIAADFISSGDFQLGEYVRSLLSNANVFLPQDLNSGSPFFRKVEINQGSLPLPEVIMSDLMGVVNAIGYHSGINKFLFSGAPGTGKTESAKQLARIMKRELYVVDFECVIDSKLGQTSKNIADLFNDIDNLDYPDQIVILFDELDALAMDRVDSRDVREMGRATSSVLKGLDYLNENVVFLATTNLITSFDKALLRRFDKIVDFNRYTKDDLLSISEVLLADLLKKYKFAGSNLKLFRKIMGLYDVIPYPGELKNVIKSSIAFSNPNENNDYLKRMLEQIRPEVSSDIRELQRLGFTLREIEILTNISKSQVARELKDLSKQGINNE